MRNYFRQPSSRDRARLADARPEESVAGSPSVGNSAIAAPSGDPPSPGSTIVGQLKKYLSKVGLFLLLVSTGACEKSCRLYEGAVVGSEHDQTNSDGFVSSLDNPVVNFSDDLRTYRRGHGPEAFETLIRTTSGAVYQDFSVYFDVKGSGSNGSESQKLYALPDVPLEMEYTFEENDHFLAVARGIKLGNGPTTLNLVHEDAFLGTRYIPQGATIKVRLKPGTILVPVQHVIVLHKPNRGLYGLDAYTDESYRQLWDDELPLVTSKYSEPDKPNRRVRHSYSPSRRILVKRPDLIWAKCGIQFRLVNVFTLLVDDAQLIQPPPSSCATGPFGGRLYPEMRRLHELVAGIPGINNQLPIVFTVHSVEGVSCMNPTGDVSEGNWATLSIKHAQSEFDEILAHEMGHILGLKDIDCDRTGESLLMCSMVLSEAITEQQCATARIKAREYASKIGWNF